MMGIEMIVEHLLLMQNIRVKGTRWLSGSDGQAKTWSRFRCPADATFFPSTPCPIEKYFPIGSSNYKIHLKLLLILKNLCLDSKLVMCLDDVLHT